MNDNKLTLVRSSRELIEKEYVGYGWENVIFKDYTTLEELLSEGFININIGRKKKQIARFFGLKKGDIVIVPVSGAIAIGEVVGIKEHVIDNIPFSANRVKVDFFKDENKKVLYVSRTELATNLERRLKVRMSITDLESFRDEIIKIVEKLKNNELYTWDSDIQKREEDAKGDFLIKLEERLKTEKDLGLAAGGIGLENLILEIFRNKGYEASIPPKNGRPAGEDVDIMATKEGEFSSKGEKYLIQAKHHRGITKRTGLDQLIACKDDEDDDKYFYKKVLITTATVSEELKKEAKDKYITIVEGKELSEWIYENFKFLSEKTLRLLGISEIPSLI
ncbi:MAG: restriction endonuclease [Sulfurovum sp.]|nr:restriction endonuclease [Sulfurovum sp.]